MIDEAASRLRMEHESKPEEIDRLDRKIIMKKMELEALKNEDDNDAAATLRRNCLQAEVNALEEEVEVLNKRWNAERRDLEAAKTATVRLDSARIEQAQCERKGNYARAGELKYVLIPKLESEVAALGFGDKKSNKMVDDVVTARNVASVVARATGIPVENLLSSERQKLLHLEEKLEERVVGQRSAVEAVANCVRLSRAGLRPHDRPLGVFMFLGN